MSILPKKIYEICIESMSRAAVEGLLFNKALDKMWKNSNSDKKVFSSYHFQSLMVKTPGRKLRRSTDSEILCLEKAKQQLALFLL